MYKKLSDQEKAAHALARRAAMLDNAKERAEKLKRAAAAREIKKAEKEALKTAIAEEQASLALAASKPPAEFQQWDYTRTHAWVQVAGVCLRFSRRRNIKLPVLLAQHQRLRDVCSMPLMEVSKLINGENAK